MKTEISCILTCFILFSSCSSNTDSAISQSDKESYESSDGSYGSTDESNYQANLDYNLEFTELQKLQKARLDELSSNNKDLSEFKPKGNCTPLKIKRGYTIKVGDLNIKKGSPLSIHGVDISVKGTDAIFDALIAFDIASKSICLALDGLPPPDSPEEREYVLSLIKEQRLYLRLFTEMKTIILSAKSENELTETLDKFQQDLVKS